MVDWITRSGVGMTSASTAKTLFTNSDAGLLKAEAKKGTRHAFTGSPRSLAAWAAAEGSPPRPDPCKEFRRSLVVAVLFAGATPRERSET